MIPIKINQQNNNILNNNNKIDEYPEAASNDVFLQLFNPFMIYLNDDEKVLDDELPAFLKKEPAFSKVIINNSEVDTIIQQSSKFIMHNYKKN